MSCKNQVRRSTPLPFPKRQVAGDSCVPAEAPRTPWPAVFCDWIFFSLILDIAFY